jgi:capsular polysaccharide export protein
MSALHHKSPIITLGKALYDLPGLTYQGRLDDFWRRAKKSDYDLFKDFRDVIIHDTQINGNFYTKKGIEMTVAASMKRFDITVVSVENEQYINSGEQTSMVVSVDVTS